MSESPADAVTFRTWVECGLRLGLTAPRTLELARAEGVQIRTAVFMAAWRETRDRYLAAGLAAAEDAA